MIEKPACWKWLIRYADGSTREVTAYSKAGALRTGKYAAKAVGCVRLAARPVFADPLYRVGTQGPRTLYDGPQAGPLDETPEAMREAR